MKLTIICIIYLFQLDSVERTSYGNALVYFPEPIVAELAKHIAPNSSGAMGRNRRGYFHVRFQLGMHRLVDYGLVSMQPKVIKRFLSAAEYSFRNQQDGGDFKIVIPAELASQGRPSQADLASGVAFFATSLGAGIYALETNDWFMHSEECKTLRQELAKLKTLLPATLNYLFRHIETLKVADRLAPNRLLFNALAFYSLGKTLNNKQAIDVAASFVQLATEQVDEAGYFIEKGGFDSSYNGVAVALGLRLILMDYHDNELESVVRKAVSWQESRIAATGEILTDGNTRVSSDSKGESFLGRTKDVDVAHTVEAFVLAALYTSEKKYESLAAKVLKHYLKQSKK